MKATQITMKQVELSESTQIEMETYYDIIDATEDNTVDEVIMLLIEELASANSSYDYAKEQVDECHTIDIPIFSSMEDTLKFDDLMKENFNMLNSTPALYNPKTKYFTIDL